MSDMICIGNLVIKIEEPCKQCVYRAEDINTGDWFCMMAGEIKGILPEACKRLRLKEVEI